MSLWAHLSAFPARQRSDVTEVRDAAQLAGHGHHAPLFGVPNTLRHTKAHHHWLLELFPAKKKKSVIDHVHSSVKLHAYIILSIALHIIPPPQKKKKITQSKHLCSSSRPSRSLWKSRFSLISSGASLYCCLSSWITELLSAACRRRSAWTFFLSASVMSPSEGNTFYMTICRLVVANATCYDNLGHLQRLNQKK